MKLPYEAACFIIPREALAFPNDEGFAQYLMYCRLTPTSVVHRAPISNTVYGVDHQSFIISSVSPKKGWDYCAQFVNEYHPLDEMPKLEFVNDEPFAADISKNEIQFNGEMARIVFNLLLIMQERPHYIEAGKKVGWHKKRNSELWSPNVIGRPYVITRSREKFHTEADGTITRNSPRTHWRRGHYHTYNVGAGRATKQLKWIEPILVNAN
jgi:hypothetical protein